MLRHGDVAYFDEQGRTLGGSTARLTERGRKQIADVAERLVACGVDRLVSSTIARALESADIIAAHLALSPVRNEAWNELQPGDLAIVAEADLRHVIVDAYRSASAPGARFFGGELFAAFAARIDRGLNDLLEDPHWTTAVVVTHDPVARYVLAKALDLGLAGLPFFEQDAGCLNIIDWLGVPGAPLCAIIRLVNGTMDDPVKQGRREPVLARFYEVYRASRFSTS